MVKPTEQIILTLLRDTLPPAFTKQLYDQTLLDILHTLSHLTLSRGFPWRREWQSTPVFLPGESHGQRSLAGYSLCGRKASDTTKRLTLGLPRWHSGKESACNAGDPRDTGSTPGIRKFPWSRKWQPTPVFLSEKSYGQRSLVGYSPDQIRSVVQSCPTLCELINCSPPGSSVHGILQARILKWFAFLLQGNLHDPEIEPTTPAFAGGFFTTKPPGKPHSNK